MPDLSPEEIQEVSRRKLVELLTLGWEDLVLDVEDDDALAAVLNEGDVLVWQSIAMLASGVIVSLVEEFIDDPKRFIREVALADQ